MLVLISVVLALALGFALKICWSDRRALRGLHLAIQNHRAFRANEIPGAESRDWRQVCADTNELIQELSRLQQLRTGQLAQLEATLGSLQEAVLIVDEQNHILLANSAFAAIFPKANNIVNERLENVLHSSVFLSYVESVRQQNAQPQKEIEFAEGELIHTENSYKYDMAGIESLAGQTGFALSRRWLDSQERFSSNLLLAH